MRETTPTSGTPAALRRVLVTGASGQDGSYLCERLLDDGAAVFGLVAAGSPCAVGGVHAIEGDLRDAASIARAVDLAEPDAVFHLAAATFVPGSYADPAATRDINVEGVRRLVDALVATGAPVRLLHASSAEIFGPPTGRPQGEDTPLAPANPYGETKAEAHRIVAAAREGRGLFACSAILFNHESPRRPPHFVTRKITLAAARIARGLERELTLGNLDAARDWGWAPEYVEAMQRIVTAPQPRDYVVATGRAITVGEFARLAFERVGLDWREHVRSDPAFVRNGEELARIGDPSRIAAELGWKAGVRVEEIVARMVDADVARLGG
jgi:GDPmannose 4,6-dehydratase